jgi:chorismate mutase / prephenate dehydratase
MRRMARRRSLTVAFQGVRGAFSEKAALGMLGDGITLYPCPSLAQVFRSVEDGTADTGLVPIENSLGGSIVDTYDLLLNRELSIVGETALPVVQCLMTLPGTKLSGIRRVYSHPQALAQCERFLSGHDWEIHAVYDTAGAAKLIAEQNLKDGAAIASAHAAQLYGLKLHREGIQDSKINVTRFVQIAREPAAATGRDRTSIVFATKDVPGALWKSLSIFAIRDINLKKLESRPSKKRVWNYVFYVDFEGHASDAPVARALEHLREISHTVKVLGSYPATC